MKTFASLPPLSVVVVTVFGSGDLFRCLGSLERQSGNIPDLEVIVVYPEGMEGISLVQRRFPQFRFHGLQGSPTQNALRASGVRVARGRLVAITVEHCTPEPDWCASILEAHHMSYAGIGGAVEMGEQPRTLTNWVLHFYDYTNYGYYLNPVRPGPAYDLSDCNVSYKKEALASNWNLWEREFNVTLINQALRTQGRTLWISPDIVVRQNRSTDLGHVVRIAYKRGKAFAGARLAHASGYQRLLYFGFSPFLPVLLIKRFVFNLIRKRCHLSTAILALPMIFLLSLVWSSGEFFGYLSGRREFGLAVHEE